ncbi:MAG: CBS domain-containing protein, partial [Nanoarchaeota archaeon]
MNVGTCALRKLITCSANDSVAKVAHMLRDARERNILVLEKEKPVGIISVSDIAYRIVAEDKDSSDTPAKAIMTKKIMIKDASEDLTPTYMEMIKANNYGCVIMEKNHVKGMLDLKEA